MTKNKRQISFIVIILNLMLTSACNTSTTNPDTKNHSIEPKDSLSDTLRTEKDTSNEVVEPVEIDYPYPTKPSKENWQQDIGEVFIMLPDTLFVKHRSLDKHIGLNHKKRKQLVSGKKVVVDQNCVVSFVSVDEYNRINRQENIIRLNIFHRCIDGPGVSYCLRPWITLEGQKIFGLFQLYGDHCCEHSIYWFLKPNENGWIDVTEKVNGKITLHDFKRDKRTFPKLEGLEEYINDPWFFTYVDHSTDTIKTYLDFDFIDLGLSEEIDDSIYNRLNYELQLIWNGRKFKKNLIERTDLDE